MLVNLPLPEKEDIINQQFNVDATHFMSFSSMMWKRVEALGILGQEKIASSKKKKKKAISPPFSHGFEQRHCDASV